MAPAPPYVCGAGTRRLHLRVDMKSAHASECRHRQHKKVEKIPLTGVVCLLTTGGLIRVRWDRICADGSPAGPLGLPQPTKDHEGTAPSLACDHLSSAGSWSLAHPSALVSSLGRPPCV